LPVQFLATLQPFPARNTHGSYIIGVTSKKQPATTGYPEAALPGRAPLLTLAVPFSPRIKNTGQLWD